MKSIVLIKFIFVFALLTSCNKDSNDNNAVMCTEEFRFVTITINGGILDDFFTLRKSTGDTIRYDRESFMENGYTVLNDNYKNKIKNKEEAFTFMGFINNSLVVNEDFVIKADECHIDYVSGTTEVNF